MKERSGAKIKLTTYCYPDSDVLINKLAIRNGDKLQDFDRRLTKIRLSELLEKPVIGQFNLEHLQRIHGYIFWDIYEWAADGIRLLILLFLSGNLKVVFWSGVCYSAYTGT